jgi:hypothetical protein
MGGRSRLRPKRKAPRYWQSHGVNPTVELLSLNTKPELNHGPVDLECEDASLDDSVLDDVSVLANGDIDEDIVITPTVERATSHIRNHAHIESATVVPVCLEVEYCCGGPTRITRASKTGTKHHIRLPGGQ